MKKHQMRQRGAATVEYVVIAGLISIIALVAVTQVGTSVDDNLTEVSDRLGPQAAPSASPDFVAANLACLEGLNVGESCDNVGLTFIGTDNSDRVYVQSAPAGGGATWPLFQYATTDRNEDFTPVVFATATGLGPLAFNELLAHPITHPGANHCASLGMYLPNRNQVRNLITPQRVELGLSAQNVRVMASTQWYFSAGVVPWYNGQNVSYFYPDTSFVHTDTAVTNTSAVVCVVDEDTVQSYPQIGAAP
ncbi:MAG: hypothetical protein Alpg2KO_24780 [Alphaproteobacteria bacterium]